MRAALVRARRALATARVAPAPAPSFRGWITPAAPRPARTRRNA